MSDENEEVIFDYKLQYIYGIQGYKWKLELMDPDGIKHQEYYGNSLSEIRDNIDGNILRKFTEVLRS